jgi:hypothetical protein
MQVSLLPRKFRNHLDNLFEELRFHLFDLYFPLYDTTAEACFQKGCLGYLGATSF